MRMVNGYFCRNCADEELAKRGMDPARPNREFAGSEVYVPPWEARAPGEKETKLGVNRPDPSGPTGTSLNLYA